MLEQQTNREWLAAIVSKAKSGEYREGVYYTRPNEQGFAIVVGWEERGEDDPITQGEYALCGKIAYNSDDLQCDYDYDWYMPNDKEGNIYDTSIAIRGESDIEYLEDELRYVSEEYDKHNLFKGDE